jgi:hypothetical protein
VTAEIVEDDDVSMPQGRHQDLLDVSQEQLIIDLEPVSKVSTSGSVDFDSLPRLISVSVVEQALAPPTN